MGYDPKNSGTNNAIQLIFGLGQTALNTSASVQNYQTEAGADKTNATLEQMSATDATERGEQDAAKYGRSFAQAFGGTETEIAGSGTDATSGSALNRLNDLRAGGALDQLTIRNDAANEAFGYTEKANQDLTASATAAAKAKSSLGAGILTGGLQLLKWGADNIKGGSGGGPSGPTSSSGPGGPSSAGGSNAGYYGNSGGAA